MADPVKPAATTEVTPAPPVPPAVGPAAKAKPEYVKVLANKRPLPYAPDVSIRISTSNPTTVPNCGWTQVQLEAEVLRLAE
jgi:hypothetical protein